MIWNLVICPFFKFNSIEPDQIVFVPLVDLPESLGSLYMTDSAWNGTQFLDNEGTYEVRVLGGGGGGGGYIVF